ncbi:MAG: hypothetical protein L6364_03700 [Desulfobulbaceae bacterium]|nr:hypothetical protein [Desulfobulbaceae bacterium]
MAEIVTIGAIEESRALGKGRISQECLIDSFLAVIAAVSAVGRKLRPGERLDCEGTEYAPTLYNDARNPLCFQRRAEF